MELVRRAEIRELLENYLENMLNEGAGLLDKRMIGGGDISSLENIAGLGKEYLGKTLYGVNPLKLDAARKKMIITKKPSKFMKYLKLIKK